ncbi:MAG: OmpA family protein [Idiomarina sp.]|nr:OmpA family protein [Idiomarina sp.]
MSRLNLLGMFSWIAGLLLLLSPPVLASYENASAQELYQRSLDTPSAIERVIIRRYLVENHSGSVEAVFAAGWLANHEDREDEAVRRYREVIERAPALSDASFNLGAILRSRGQLDDALRVFKGGLDANPNDYMLVRDIYFHLAEDMDAMSEARQFLQQQTRRLGSDHWVIQLILGLHAQFQDRDLSGAARHYRDSARAGAPTEAMRRYVNLSIDQLNADPGTILRTGIDHAIEHEDTQLLRDLGDRLARMNYRQDALQMYENSMRIYPNAEALKNATDNLFNWLPTETLSFVDEWAPRMPDNWQAQATLAQTYDSHRYDFERARQLRERSIALAPHSQSRAQAVTQAVTAWHATYALDIAKRVLEEHAESLPRAADRNLMNAYLAENRTKAGDYVGAQQVLSRLPDGNVVGVNDNWLMGLRESLARATGLQSEREQFFQENPFLQRWDERFGESLVLSVEFELNSARIHPRAHRMLAEAAAALKAAGGEDYVFLVEGHTDITGTDAINLPLSEQRARSVADFLSREHDVSRERLQSIGHGSNHPIATNETEQGRQSNRRVEIRPYGIVSRPEVVVSGHLDADNIAVSPDGRFIASGQGPIQLWDTRRNVKVRELFRGGSIRDFSPDSRYLAVASSYTEVSGNETNALYIMDTKTGHVVAQILSPSRITDLSWSPFGDGLVFGNMLGNVILFDMKSRTVRAANRAGSIESSTLVEWLADGERIVSTQAVSGTTANSRLRVWRAEDLQEIESRRGRAWPHAMRASRDGRWLVTVDNDRQIVIHDTSDWSTRTLRAPMIPKRMQSHPDRPWMVMNDFTQGDDGVAVLDIEAGQIVATASTNSLETGVGFTPDGSQVIVGYEDRIRWLDSSSLREVNTFDGQAAGSLGLLIDRVNDYVINTDDAGTTVFNLTTGRRVHRMVTESEFVWSALNSDASRLATVDTNGNLVVFDSNDFSEQRRFRFDFDVTQNLHVEGDYIVAVGTPRNQNPSARSVGRVVVLNKSDFSVVSRIEMPLVTELVRYGRVIDPQIRWIAVDSARNRVAFNTTWQDGFGRARQNSRTVQVFRLDNGRSQGDFQMNHQVNGFRFDREGLLAIGRRGAGEAFFDVSTGGQVRTEPARTRFELDLGTGETLYWARDYMALNDKTVRFPDSLRRVATHPARNLLIAQTAGNELLFFDIKTLERHLTIVVKRNDQWIAYTPEGHFASSEHGTEGVFWSQGDHFLPFDALRNQMERGRLIQERLRALMEDDSPTEVVHVDEPSIDPALFETPYQVNLLSETGIDTNEPTYRVRLEVTKASVDLPDPEVRYRLNGRPVARTRGFEEEAVWDSEEIVTIERQLDLQEGHNRIEVALHFRNADVERQVIEVNRRVQQRPEEISSQTQLWFFAVGVSDYELSTQNLEFAHRDALALEEVMKEQEGVLFNKVNTRVLVNDEATERNVRVELNDFLRQASAEDLIIIFLAGHGVQDNEQNLYFMTHDGDMQRPFTGMAIDRFRDFLQSRPLNQKALFMMDICHAGSTGPRRRGRVTSEDAVQQLSEGTGTIVFASSTGAQSSLEDASFGGGHGAFTAALLEAFRGHADRQSGNNDGFNSVHEVISYTSRRVPQITQGAQHPTVPMLQNVRDFPLTIAAPEE